MTRTFRLNRLIDLTGTSGLGLVASGRVESSGKTIMQWTATAKLADGTSRKINTVTHYETWQDVVLLHGHGGKTVLIWDDTNESVSDWDLLLGLKAA